MAADASEPAPSEIPEPPPALELTAAEAPEFLPNQQQITQGIEAVEREEERREEELESPAASQEREETRTAFTNLTVGEAKELLLGSFPEQLEGLNTDPGRFLSDAEIVHTAGEEAAVVSEEGDTSLMEAGIPIRTENEEGEVSKVDLSLVEADAGFEARNPLVDVQIPSSAEAPVEVGGEGLGISLAGAAGAAQPLGDQNVFYHDVQPDSDLLVSPVSHGVELFDQLRSPQSPETLHFQIDLPEGAELRADGSGGAEVVRGDEAVASIPSPMAADAQGSEVPVDLQVEGNTLALQVSHREADFAYPILVDPIVEDWLNAGLNWSSGYSYKALENGAWQWTSEPYGQMYIGTSCFYTCWGSGRGLYVTAPSRNYGSEVHAHWAYLAPNAGSYISQVWLNPLNWDVHGCSSYQQPHDYEGLWTGSKWEPLKTSEASKGIFTLQANEGWKGQSFIVGLSTAGGVNIPCWRDLAVGGAAIWLDDKEPPTQPNVTGMPSGWLKKGSSYTLNVEASSSGLGVQKIRLISPGEKEWLWNQPWCSGLYENRCAASRSGQLTFNTEAFMEGNVPVSVNAMSASGKVGPPRSYELQVDGSAPNIKLSGQFAKATEGEGKEELSLPVYNLTVKAEDLLGTGPAIGSGVREIKLFLNGKALESKGPTCSSTSCPSTFEYTFAVPLTGLDEGENFLETRTKDFVGNETSVGESKIGFKYFPATGMKEDYVLQHFVLPDGHDYSGEPEYRGPELAVNVINGNVVYRERDLQVQAPSGDLDLERIYNSQQPSSRDGQWGHGWSLAQAPEFKPTAGTAPETATMVRTSAVTNPVQLPQSQTQTVFDPELHATIAQAPGGGYEVTSAIDEETSVFNSSGRIEETRLSSVSPETTVQPEPVFPVFVESLGSAGSGNGQLNHPADAAADAKGNLWIVDSGNSRIEQFSEAGEFVRAAGSLGVGAAQLKSPSAIAIDSAGNVDVTDTGNNRVVRFNEKGEFLSAVGWNVNKTKVEAGATQAEKNLCTAASKNVCQAGTAGALEGQMTEPVGITTIGGQEFFVVERGNSRVEKFGPQGELLAKFGSAGSGGGQMAEPTGIAYSANNGYLWIADTGNNRLEKWTTAGVSAGKVGWEGSSPGLFKHPTAIEADTEGNLYVADTGNQRVQMLSRSGDYITQFGTEGQLSLTAPAGVFVNSAGELWVTDSEGGRVQKWLTGSSILMSSRIGSLGSGNGQFFHPADVAVDGKNNIWALDQGNSRIEKFNEKGEFLTTFGAESQATWKLSQPSALAVDQSNNGWVADTAKNRVVEFGEAGQFILTFGRNVNKTKVDANGTEAEKNVCTAASGNVCQAGTAGTTGAQLSAPKGIAIASDGSVWVSDTGNNRLKKFSSAGVLLATVASEGTGGGQVKEPMAITVAPDKSIWVADSGNNRIEQWSPTLGFLRKIGSEGSGNGQFKQPTAIDTDASGHIWVGDQLNDRVQEFTSTGAYVAQYGDSSQFAFGRPMGVTSDGKGNIWVTDSEHNRIQRLPATQFAEPVVAQVPAVDYSYGSGLLTKMELEEPEAPDPSIAVTSSSGLASTASSDAGTATYSYSSGNLTSTKDPDGETKYERDTSNRIKKVELPNGTWAKITYDEIGRALTVTVKPAGGTEKTTSFWYSKELRETKVWGGGNPEIIYSFGEDGSLVKWWYAKVHPTLEGFEGSLWSNRNSPTPIESKNHYFAVTAKSQNEIASVQLLVNGTAVVAEETCEDKAQPPDHHCDAVRLDWVTHAAAHPPGRLNLEIVATDFLGEKTAEPFFVTIPQQPPTDPEAPEPPTFESIKQFREDYGLDRSKSTSKSELTRFILELLYEWEAQVPTAVTAVANWGIPMRAPELAEMEERKQIAQQASEVIPQWAEEHAAASYGGFYVDDKAGGKIFVGFTENQGALVSALKQEAGLMSPAMVFEFPTPPTRSVANLEAFAQSVTEALRKSSVTGAAVSVEVSPGGNSVEVGATDPSSVRTFLAGQFGSSAPIAVHEEEPESLMLSRFPSSGSVNAGAALAVGPSFCTAGFGSRAKTGEARGAPVYSYFALTAGHCWPHGLTVYRQNERLGETNEDAPVGEVKRGPYSVSDFRVTDAEAIRIDSGLRSHSVLNPPPNSRVLEAQSFQGVEAPKVNRFVCWSGVMSGPQCGMVTTRYEAVQEDGHERVLYKVAGPSISGDSGGPVWNPITHKAVGLITTGVRSPQKKCHVVYVELLSCPRMGFTPLIPGKLNGEMPGVNAFLGVQTLKEE